jgi:HK97 family phage major capsid protein
MGDCKDPSGEGPSSGDVPPADRPFGTRPFGTRPFGTRPFGTRPFGTRPERPPQAGFEDERPFGTRPFGTRPFGTRPFGTRPFGTRPFGTRPFGTRGDGGDGLLDPDEWADDIAELFFATSAVVRLGASIVVADEPVRLPSIESAPGVARYIPRPAVIDPSSAPQPDTTDRKKPAADAGQRILRPERHEVAVTVAIPNEVARALAETPELAWPLKQDLADDLALAADRAFLRGAGDDEPLGITSTFGVLSLPPGTDFIGAFRRALAQAYATQTPLRAPGWVISAARYAALVTALTDDGRGEAGAGGRTLDNSRLLTYDGNGGGLLFGYPFAITPAATQPGAMPPVDEVYFAADWREAWIAVDRQLVTVDLSTDADFGTDETVVRAVMRHDFVVRRPRAFVHTVPPALHRPLP